MTRTPEPPDANAGVDEPLTDDDAATGAGIAEERDGEGDLAAPRRAGRRRLKRVLRVVATVVVVGVVGWFFARSLIDNWEQVAAEGLRFSWWWIPATLCFVLAVPATGLCWGRIVRVLAPETTVRPSEAIAVQCLSWVLKYIPGQVGSVANKVLWASKKGISRTLIVISFIYENVFLQLASLIPGAIILLVSLGPGIFGDNATLLIAPLVAIVPLAVIMWRPAFHAILDFPARAALKRRIPREYFLSTPQTLRSLVEFLAPRVLNCVGFVVLAGTIVDLEPSMWLPFGAAYLLGAAIGILAVFVPSGIGVREAVIVAVLGQYIPVPQAIIISLLARLMSTVGDVLVAAIYLVARRMSPVEIRP